MASSAGGCEFETCSRQWFKFQPHLHKPVSPLWTNRAIWKRVHFLNVISHTETTDDEKSEVKVRIMQRRAGQQAATWETRKTQIQKHLQDQTVVNQQLNLEKSAYMNPLQTKRSDGTYGSPFYSKLMPPEYTKWVEEGKACHDYR